MKRIWTCLLLLVVAGLPLLMLAVPAKKPTKADDDRFLDMIQKECYQFFVKESSPETGFAPDHLKVNYASTAGIGFQLATMIIADVRGYEPKPKIRAQVLKMMRTLKKCPTKYGFYYHFLDMKTGLPSTKAYEFKVSSIDTVLLMFGVIAAGEHFGGEVKTIADQLYKEMDFQSFLLPKRPLIAMAWSPASKDSPMGPGELTKYSWDYFTDESVLATILGIGSPREDALGGDYFYRWTRNMQAYKPLNPENKSPGKFVVSWSGAMFTYQFAHLFIDFSKLGHDQPSKHNLPKVPSVDWFANSRTATLTARLYCMERVDSFPSYGPNSWGPTASATTKGYAVDGFVPCPEGENRRNRGHIAPYGAGTSIMFTPEESIAALRHYVSLSEQGIPVWQKASEGGYGFWDSFSPDSKVSKSILAIDHGPLIIGIENYRTGLIQKLVMRNKNIQRALIKIGFENIKTKGSGK